MWIEVGSDAPFELVKQSSSKKGRAPKLRAQEYATIIFPYGQRLKDIPTKEVEENAIKKSWLNEKKSPDRPLSST